MKKLKRTQLFVDREVQGAFFTRTCIYWFVWVVSCALVVAGIHLATGVAHLSEKPLEDPWVYLRPVLVTSILLLPIALYDVVVLSNRVAGAMTRIRRAMHRLAAGEHVEPIKCREKDFWTGFAAEVNAVIARVEHLERELERANVRNFAADEALAVESSAL